MAYVVVCEMGAFVLADGMAAEGERTKLLHGKAKKGIFYDALDVHVGFTSTVGNDPTSVKK